MSLFLILHKIQLQMNPKIRGNTFSQIEEGVWNMLQLIDTQKDFLNRILGVWVLRSTTDKWDYMKLKSSI